LTYLLLIFSLINPQRSSVQAVIVVPTRELGMQVSVVVGIDLKSSFDFNFLWYESNCCLFWFRLQKLLECWLQNRRLMWKDVLWWLS